jgi:hypothetical protein
MGLYGSQQHRQQLNPSLPIKLFIYGFFQLELLLLMDEYAVGVLSLAISKTVWYTPCD